MAPFSFRQLDHSPARIPIAGLVVSAILHFVTIGVLVVCLSESSYSEYINSCLWSGFVYGWDAEIRFWRETALRIYCETLILTFNSLGRFWPWLERSRRNISKMTKGRLVWTFRRPLRCDSSSAPFLHHWIDLHVASHHKLCHSQNISWYQVNFLMHMLTTPL